MRTHRIMEKDSEVEVTTGLLLGVTVTGPSLLPARATSTRSVSVETWIGTVFIWLWLGGILLGLPVCLPSAESFWLIEKYFFSTTLFAGSLPLTVAWLLPKGQTKHNGDDPFATMKLLPLIFLTIFLHFNFKAWMPLINPVLFDSTYNAIDQTLAPLHSIFLSTRSFIAERANISLDPLYQQAFFIMFFISASVHAGLDTTARQRQLLVGTCMIMLLGEWLTGSPPPLALLFSGAD